MSGALRIAAFTIETSDGGRTLAIIGGSVLVYLVINAIVAGYGRGKGYPFLPLFISSVFLGFPVVLLVVTIAAGRRPRSGLPERPRERK
jgi:hypothetical protein